jgi:hypothetical protein
MTLRRTYAPMLPEFDDFLFASVGEEVEGIQPYRPDNASIKGCEKSNTWEKHS